MLNVTKLMQVDTKIAVKLTIDQLANQSEKELKQEIETMFLDGGMLTIGLFVQPEVVRDVPPTFKERGLMQRFLYSFPLSLVGHRKRLGHSDIQMTMNIYTHVTDTLKEQIAQKLQKYIVL